MTAEKEKVIVYPFDIQFVPILRHSCFISDFEIIGLISPSGWGLCGKDAGCADYGETIGIKVGSDFEALLEACDTVIFTESHIPLDFKKNIQPKIDKAVQKRKNIICTVSTGDEFNSIYSMRCKDQGTYFKYYNFTRNEGDANECEAEYIHKIDAPVVFVMGMGERAHKFQIQLDLREHFKRMGYRISQIGSRSYCEMLGFHSVPAFMYGNCVPDYKKIILFNHYVKGIEISEKPDLIIIGIPGGMMPFNNEFTNRFGITAYEISRAVAADAVVLSTLYEDYKPEYFKELYTVIKYRFGAEVDCYNLANVKFDWDGSSQNGSATYITIDSRLVDEKRKGFLSLDTPVFNTLNPDSAGKMADYLIERLINYGDVESM